MRRALKLKLAERRNSIPTNWKIESDAQFLGCLPQIATGCSRAREKSVGLFAGNPGHQSSRFKKVNGQEPIFSGRVALGYRALGLLEGDDITWSWIGAHADYDRLLARL